MQIQLAATDADIERCYSVMAQLRPHLETGQFVARVRELIQQGYRIAFIEQAGSVRAVAGFRFGDNLFLGRFLYIDDLVTDADARSQGLGAALFAWCRELAIQEGCDFLQLDSGVQRSAAHRFYFSQRMSITSYRFSLALK